MEILIGIAYLLGCLVSFPLMYLHNKRVVTNSHFNLPWSKTDVSFNTGICFISATMWPIMWPVMVVLIRYMFHNESDQRATLSMPGVDLGDDPDGDNS